MSDFARTILMELETAFPEGELETLIRRDQPMGNAPPTAGCAVRVIHSKSGCAEDCEEFESQIMNKAIALTRLLKALR